MANRLANFLIQTRNSSESNKDLASKPTQSQAANHMDQRRRHSKCHQPLRATPAHQPASILNVAEMILHGIADQEIINIWLGSIACERFVANFIQSGYDMTTISRMTPQDLIAIGIKEPATRSMLLDDIKKWNLHNDHLPKFLPSSLQQLLKIVNLEEYLSLLCKQQIDTIDKLILLGWEDFEDLGISKLGHQKKLHLTIERIKQIKSGANNNKQMNSSDSRTSSMAEPIYDTCPSQIYLLARSQNHNTNSQVFSKQSSTGELSSSDSAESMQSVYSSNSSHHLAVSQIDRQHLNQRDLDSRSVRSQSILPINLEVQHQKQTDFLASIRANRKSMDSIYFGSQSTVNEAKSTPADVRTKRISLGQFLPFLNLQSKQQNPQNEESTQQTQLSEKRQQNSVYATISRRHHVPRNSKPTPPAPPIRRTSLKTNEVDDISMTSQSVGNDSLDTMTTSSRASHERPQSESFHSSRSLLTRNKSFSGGAYNAARAKYFRRASQQRQSILVAPPINMTPDFGSVNYDPGARSVCPTICHEHTTRPQLRSFLSDASPSSAPSLARRSSDQQVLSMLQRADILQTDDGRRLQSHYQASDIHVDDLNSNICPNSPHSQFGRINILSASSVRSSEQDINHQINLTTGTSQIFLDDAPGDRVYDQNKDFCNVSPMHQIPNDHQQVAATSADTSPTLSSRPAKSNPLDVSVTSEQRSTLAVSNQMNYNATPADTIHCNATTGKDDSFPSPPSPLSLNDSLCEQNDIVPMKSFLGPSSRNQQSSFQRIR